MLTRLARLGSDAVSLAQALAVLGSQTEVGVAAELAALEPAAAELTADRLVAAQILAPTRPLDFFHSLGRRPAWSSRWPVATRTDCPAAISA